MKAELFKNFKEGKNLSWNVDHFLPEQEETQEFSDESEDSKTTAGDV